MLLEHWKKTCLYFVTKSLQLRESFFNLDEKQILIERDKFYQKVEEG